MLRYTRFYALLGIVPRKTKTQIKDFDLNLTEKIPEKLEFLNVTVLKDSPQH